MNAAMPRLLSSEKETMNHLCVCRVSILKKVDNTIDKSYNIYRAASAVSSAYRRCAKRESGENPERSGHCIRRVCLQDPIASPVLMCEKGRTDA